MFRLFSYVPTIFLCSGTSMLPRLCMFPPLPVVSANQGSGAGILHIMNVNMPEIRLTAEKQGGIAAARGAAVFFDGSKGML